MSAITVYYRDMKECKKLFKDRFDIEASDKDCEVIRRVCEAVSTRAARLAAAGIVALVKKINKMDGCTVAVDGSTYKRDRFPDRYVLQLRNVMSTSFMMVTIMHPYRLNCYYLLTIILRVPWKFVLIKSWLHCILCIAVFT